MRRSLLLHSPVPFPNSGREHRVVNSNPLIPAASVTIHLLIWVSISPRSGEPAVGRVRCPSKGETRRRCVAASSPELRIAPPLETLGHVQPADRLPSAPALEQGTDHEERAGDSQTSDGR